MAEPLKNMYNPAFFEKLCPILKECIPGFDCRDFIFRVFNNSWSDLELKQRVRHVAKTLHHFLPEDFPKAAKLLANLSQHLRATGVRQQSFGTIFICDYIQVYGLAYPDESLKALEEITKLVSAEFAIRPFIIQYPKKAMQQLNEWASHPEANVRRLSSEGCRPRLPWAIALSDFKKDPSPILPILEKLKNDPSEYVRRSVANNLNDIAKDHPELILKISKQWHQKHPDTDKIIRHACRTLLKKGHLDALAIHGFNQKSKAKVKNLLLPKKVKLGDYFDFSFDFISGETKPTNFRLEYAISYLTSSGKTSYKVFMISEHIFKPNETKYITRKRPFKHFTTRKIYKGVHHFTLLVNGKKIARHEFLVC
jgi:3-methyladenine DNA glycosylase AlkC